MILRLKPPDVKLLIRTARAVFPIEACAMLIGHATHKEAVTERIVLTPNKLCSVDKFEIDPEIVISTITKAEQEGLNFIGLFHSHPMSAFPSPFDIQSMKQWKDTIWLILSTTEYRLAAYQWTRDELEEIAVSTK